MREAELASWLGHAYENESPDALANGMSSSIPGTDMVFLEWQWCDGYRERGMPKPACCAQRPIPSQNVQQNCGYQHLHCYATHAAPPVRTQDVFVAYTTTQQAERSGLLLALVAARSCLN